MHVQQRDDNDVVANAKSGRYWTHVWSSSMTMPGYKIFSVYTTTRIQTKYILELLYHRRNHMASIIWRQQRPKSGTYADRPCFWRPFFPSKLNREASSRVSRGELWERVSNACICHLPLCFRLKFHISIEPILFYQIIFQPIRGTPLSGSRRLQFFFFKYRIALCLGKENVILTTDNASHWPEPLKHNWI